MVAYNSCKQSQSVTHVGHVFKNKKNKKIILLFLLVLYGLCGSTWTKWIRCVDQSPDFKLHYSQGAFFSLIKIFLLICVFKTKLKNLGEHTCVMWAERVCSWEKEAAFMWPRRGGVGGGPGVGGTLRVACRFHWERGRHQVNIYELSPLRHCSLFFPLFSLWRLDLPVSTRGYLFQDNIWNKPKRGSMRTLRGSHRHLWSWRGGMYRFFVKLTFLIPAIVISQGKLFPKQICERELWALKEKTQFMRRKLSLILHILSHYSRSMPQMFVVKW